jgi:hypothetical protein
VNNDKHVDAYGVLSQPRGKKMGNTLGWEVATNDACVACHGVVMKDGNAKDKNFKLENEGVSCCVCHGPFKEWITQHGAYPDIDKWRKFDHFYKEAHYGMTNLWNLAERAELCVSCHVGASQRAAGPFQAPVKFVTHKMYAAGHPPLPSFEVATFSDQMPRHWQYRREKDAPMRQLLHHDGKDLEQTHLIVVGAAVSLRESMRLLADQARECVRATDPEKATLDFANFDCYACHHDLKSPSWRQKRGLTGTLGRVPMRPIPTALVKLAVRHVSGGKEGDKREAAFSQLLKGVEEGFNKQPFGDPGTIAPAAAQLAEWADGLAKELNEKGKDFDKEAVARLLALLPRIAQEKAPDYDSARQIAWAYRTMQNEYCEVTKAKPPETVRKAVEDLDSQLKLVLPAGRKASIDTQLGECLAARNQYDPEKFEKAMRELAADPVRSVTPR